MELEKGTTQEGFSIVNYSSERGGSFWLSPSTQKLRSDGITKEWTGCSRLTQGLIDLARSSDLCCICRPTQSCGLDRIQMSSMGFSLWEFALTSEEAGFLISLHGDGDPRNSSPFRRQWALQSISAAAQYVHVLWWVFLCWPGLVWPLIRSLQLDSVRTDEELDLRKEEHQREKKKKQLANC